MSSGESYYRYESTDGCLIVTLLPELNDKQWADIERVGTEIVDRLSNAQSPRFIVDLTPLSYMGSAMVALIVRLYKTVNGRNGQMVVVNQHELVQEVLKLAGLTKLWTIVENRDQAFAALGVKRRAVSAEGSPAEGGNALLLAGIIGAVGAVIGLALQFSSQPLVSRKVALLIDVGFAALGMVVGTMMLVNQTGARRNVGIALLAICLIVVLGGIVFSPEHTTAPLPVPASNGTSSTAPATPLSETPAVAATNPSTANTPAGAPAAAASGSAAQPMLLKRKDK
ncbi:MAG TPA: STAS domain-containing protein [Planctomycetaceae bacterium]|nr:STAS domain-containing protein [Planctomycetaceae bacterium]